MFIYFSIVIKITLLLRTVSLLYHLGGLWSSFQLFLITSSNITNGPTTNYFVQHSQRELPGVKAFKD